MPVTDFTTDPDTRTITVTAHFDAPVERVWAIYADPRRLEQVWGPPECPATFVDHELAAGTRSTYFMTGPNGEKFCGYWNITDVDEQTSFTFDDGFAHEDFTPRDDLPVSHSRFTFSPDDGGTTLVGTTTYDSADALQQVLDMGVEEGTRGAMGQIDAVLARAA